MIWLIFIQALTTALSEPCDKCQAMLAKAAVETHLLNGDVGQLWSLSSMMANDVDGNDLTVACTVPEKAREKCSSECLSEQEDHLKIVSQICTTRFFREFLSLLPCVEKMKTTWLEKCKEVSDIVALYGAARDKKDVQKENYCRFFKGLLNCEAQAINKTCARTGQSDAVSLEENVRLVIGFGDWRLFDFVQVFPKMGTLPEGCLGLKMFSSSRFKDLAIISPEENKPTWHYEVIPLPTTSAGSTSAPRPKFARETAVTQPTKNEVESIRYATPNPQPTAAFAEKDHVDFITLAPSETTRVSYLHMELKDYSNPYPKAAATPFLSGVFQFVLTLVILGAFTCLPFWL